jgi:phage/plasmid-associated DNA primase
LRILDVWCGGDKKQFRYVMRWMALLVQKPSVKPEVALVLRSKEGTGKTMIVQLLLKIFGPHGFTTAQKDQVARRFNGHLFDKVLVVLEEAFFAGDPATVAAAKALVTNPTLGYEAKGKDAFSAPNYAHVITLTNNA